MNNQTSLFRLISSVLILSLVMSLAPVPAVYATDEPGTSPGPTTSLSIAGQSAHEIAGNLERTYLQAKQATGQDIAIVWSHLGTSTENPALLGAVQILNSKGITVTGNLVTLPEMRDRIVNSVVGENGLATALHIEADPAMVAVSVERFLRKCGKLTLWHHIKKWKDDWKKAEPRRRAFNMAYSLFAAVLGSGWFIWAAGMKGAEKEFTTRLSSAAGQIFGAETLADLGTGLFRSGESFAHLSTVSMIGAGLLTFWIFMYQVGFPAIHSFRTQWLEPHFDPLKPAREQLRLGQANAYSRVFFFLASVGIELIITIPMTALFVLGHPPEEGGHVQAYWLFIAAGIFFSALSTSIASSMAYMPSEALAGLFNEREAAAQSLYVARREILEAQGVGPDDVAIALKNAAFANGTIASLERFAWWEFIYGPLRNSFLLGVQGIVGAALKYSFLGFFLGGLGLDTWASRGSLKRKIDNYYRRKEGTDTAFTAECSDWLEFRSVETQMPKLAGNSAASAPQDP